MNTALLEELVRRKAEEFRLAGLPTAEAIDRAGDEIFRCFAAGSGHGSRFCLRMWLNGAKKRIRPDQTGKSEVAEGEKIFSALRCVVNPSMIDRPGCFAA